MRPVTITSSPSWGLSRNRPKVVFQITASMQRALVLQGEIAWPERVRPAIAGNLAAHPHVAEGVLERPLEREGELRHRPFGRVEGFACGIMAGP